jgi:uncharacterized membrane protein
VPMRTDVLLAIAVMCAASNICRLAGFFLMRYVAITPRVEAWLRSIPMALIGAALGPVAAKGGPPEWAGLAVALGLMRLTNNDFLAIVAAVLVVAGARWAGLAF